MILSKLIKKKKKPLQRTLQTQIIINTTKQNIPEHTITKMVTIEISLKEGEKRKHVSMKIATVRFSGSR